MLQYMHMHIRGVYAHIRTYVCICIPWLVLWLLASLPAGKSAVCLELNSGFISPHNIKKIVILVPFCPLQPLHLVSMTDQLAICTPSKRPSEFGPTTQDCPKR